jgi:hypothetical protein
VDFQLKAFATSRFRNSNGPASVFEGLPRPPAGLTSRIRLPRKDGVEKQLFGHPKQDSGDGDVIEKRRPSTNFVSENG